MLGKLLEEVECTASASSKKEKAARAELTAFGKRLKTSPSVKAFVCAELRVE